jgi:hypothetical protein
MKPSGKPDAGNLPVRFDEGDGDGEGRTISTLRRWSLVRQAKPDRPYRMKGSIM